MSAFRSDGTPRLARGLLAAWLALIPAAVFAEQPSQAPGPPIPLLPSPPPAAWFELAEAARAKRIGETVLAAILVASPAETLATDPISLFAAASGLREVGLEADARRLAVESAVAAGL